MAEFDERAYRDTLGAYATGVTIVTTLTARGPLGMTANSFASVSLDPPLVLWSPARRSLRFPAFEAASHFAIHILSVEQEDLSRRFARRGDDFEGLSWEDGVNGTPLLPGCVARLECAHAAGHDAGDHLIVVGQVQRFTRSDRQPLVYHNGRYTRLY